MSKKQKKNEKKKTKIINQIRLDLTKTDLIHIRDLMSILLPSNDGMTVSKGLAVKETRTLQEIKLYEKIYSLCQENEIPVGQQAPDYFVGLKYMPDMDVMLMNYPDEIGEQEYYNDEDAQHEETEPTQQNGTV